MSGTKIPPVLEAMASIMTIGEVRLTYCMPLLQVLLRERHQPVEVVSKNLTARGVEATVKYQSVEEDAPQLYRITVEPLYDED